MFVQSNQLIDLLPYFKKKLTAIYTTREIENIFYWICEHRYQLNKIEIKQAAIRLTETELLEFRAIVKRLEKEEPIQYILGETEFWGLPILVNEHTLIPRPETEELVHLMQQDLSGNLVVLDIGTGSGCIPIALKKEIPSLTVYALDISAQAIDLAKKSAQLNHVAINFVQKDILTQGLDELVMFDVICSNPPYVLQSDQAEMNANVLNYEPHLALFVADEEPLLFYKRIAELAQVKLKPNGKLFFEIHENYGQETKKMLEALNFSDIQIFKDLQGKDRMIRAVYN